MHLALHVGWSLGLVRNKTKMDRTLQLYTGISNTRCNKNHFIDSPVDVTSCTDRRMDRAIVTCGHQGPDHTRKRKTKDAYIKVSLRTALQQACTITKQQYYVPVTVRVILYRVCTLTVILSFVTLGLPITMLHMSTAIARISYGPFCAARPASNTSSYNQSATATGLINAIMRLQKV